MTLQQPRRRFQRILLLVRTNLSPLDSGTLNFLQPKLAVRPAQKLIPLLRPLCEFRGALRPVAGVLKHVIEDLGFSCEDIRLWRNVAHSSFDLTNDWLFREEGRHKLLIDSLWKRYSVNRLDRKN